MRPHRVRKSSAPLLLPVEPAMASTADLSGLPRTALAAMIEAGREVRDCQRVLAKTGDNIVGELLRGQGTFYEWNHYPPDDVHDLASHAQYYYHAHGGQERSGEHGHFHCFLRPKGMPAGIRPAPVSAAPSSKDGAEPLSHLVAISMDDGGQAIELFTTNRWVTDETWYRARDVIAMLDRFVIDVAHPSWPVNRWITAMIRLFRPQIEQLVWERDRAVAAWQRRDAASDVFEDRRLEVTSKIAISVEDQIGRLQAAARRPRR